MRKVLRFKWVIVILIPVIFISSMVVSANNTENQKKISREYASKLILPPEGEYNEDIIEGIKDRLSLVPAHYLKLLFDKQVYIKTVNGPVTSAYEFPKSWIVEEDKDYFNSIGGAFANPYIILRADEEYDIGVEIHEVGHAVDWVIFNDISTSNEFMNIYNTEGKKVYSIKGLTDKYHQNSREYFAQAFYYYYFNYNERKMLKETAPLTYKFIKDLESRKIN